MSRYEKRYWDPTGARWGIPTYPWRMAPDGLATRRQLADLGLRPGGAPIVGQLMWSRRNRTVVAYLYAIETAKPRREATPAVLASLDRARAGPAPLPRVRPRPRLHPPGLLGHVHALRHRRRPHGVGRMNADQLAPADTASAALAALGQALHDLVHVVETIAYAVMLDEPIPYQLTNTAPHAPPRNKS